MVPTVRLISIGNPVPGNQEFCLAPSKTMVGRAGKINKKSHLSQVANSANYRGVQWSGNSLCVSSKYEIMRTCT